MPLPRFRRPIVPARQLSGVESQKLNIPVYYSHNGQTHRIWTQWLPAILTGQQEDVSSAEVERAIVRARPAEGLKIGTEIIRGDRIWIVKGLEGEGVAISPQINRWVVEFTGRTIEVVWDDLNWCGDIAKWN